MASAVKFAHKELYSLEHRIDESRKMVKRFPERVPIVVQRVPGSTIPELDKHKFLVPHDVSVTQFIWVIRRRINVGGEQAIFLFVGNIIPQSSSTIGQLYNDHKDEDGFLYIAYSGENSFGEH
ncbi:hypothetical protein ACOME3_002715 [Neoechinorhynchus agilis]